MNPSVESLASRYGVPPLEALEYYLDRLEVRHGSESDAIADLTIWARLWVAIKGDCPQLDLRVASTVGAK